MSKIPVDVQKVQSNETKILDADKRKAGLMDPYVNYNTGKQ